MNDEASLFLDDPRDEALAETRQLLDGTAEGACAFIEIRATLRAIRKLEEK